MKIPIYFDKSQQFIQYDKRQLLKNESVSVLKENLLVGDVVCYFERESSNPMYRFGIIKSFWKRCGIELVSITDVRSDLSTFDTSIELSEYNFIVGLNMDTIYYTNVAEHITKKIEDLKKELKTVRKKLRDLKKTSHLSKQRFKDKRRFKDLDDSLQK